MTKKFSIALTSTHKNKPLISKYIIEYFERFVYDYIMTKYNVLLSSKTNVILGFTLIEAGIRSPSKVRILKTQIVNGDKVCSILIPINEIFSNNTKLKVIDLFFEGIKVFFLSNYKRLNESVFNELYLKLDMDFLLGIPYPAEISDVNYIEGMEPY
jgi:hypothetical protein